MAIRVKYEPAAVGLALASDLAGRGQLAKERQKFREQQRQFEEQQRQFDTGQEFRGQEFDEGVRRFDLGFDEGSRQFNVNKWLDSQRLLEGQRQYNLSLQERFAKDRKDRQMAIFQQEEADRRATLAQQGAMARQGIQGQQAMEREQARSADNMQRWHRDRAAAQMNSDWKALQDKSRGWSPEQKADAVGKFEEKWSNSGNPMPFNLPESPPTANEVAVQKHNAKLAEEGKEPGVYIDRNGDVGVYPWYAAELKDQSSENTRQKKNNKILLDLSNDQAGMDITTAEIDADLSASEEKITAGLIKSGGRYDQESGEWEWGVYRKDPNAEYDEADLDNDGFVSKTEFAEHFRTTRDDKLYGPYREGLSSPMIFEQQTYEDALAQTGGTGVDDSRTKAEVIKSRADYESGLAELEAARGKAKREKQKAMRVWQNGVSEAIQNGTVTVVVEPMKDGDPSIEAQLAEKRASGDPITSQIASVGPDGKPIKLFPYDSAPAAPRSAPPAAPPAGPPARPTAVPATAPAPALVAAARKYNRIVASGAEEQGPPPATAPALPDIIPMETDSEGYGVGDIGIIRGPDGNFYYDDGQRTPVAPRDTSRTDGAGAWEEIGDARGMEEGSGMRFVASSGRGHQAAQMYPIQAKKHRRSIAEYARRAEEERRQAFYTPEGAGTLAGSPEDTQVVEPPEGPAKAERRAAFKEWWAQEYPGERLPGPGSRPVFNAIFGTQVSNGWEPKGGWKTPGVANIHRRPLEQGREPWWNRATPPTGKPPREAPKSRRGRQKKRGGESRYIKPFHHETPDPETGEIMEGRHFRLKKEPTRTEVKAYDKAVANAVDYARYADDLRSADLRENIHPDPVRRKGIHDARAARRAEEERKRKASTLPPGLKNIPGETQYDRYVRELRRESDPPEGYFERSIVPYPEAVRDILGKYPDPVENRRVNISNEVAPAPGVRRGNYFGEIEGKVRMSEDPLGRVRVTPLQSKFDVFDAANKEHFEAHDRWKEVRETFEDLGILQGWTDKDIYEKIVMPYAGRVTGGAKEPLHIPNEDKVRMDKLKGEERKEAYRKYEKAVMDYIWFYPEVMRKTPAERTMDPSRQWMGNPDHDPFATDDPANEWFDKKYGRPSGNTFRSR